MAISPDGRRIAAADDKGIQQWDVERGEAVGTRIEGDGGINFDITYSSDGRYLVSANWDSVRFWDIASGRQLGELIDTTFMGLTAHLDVSPDGRRVFVTGASASPDGQPPYHGGGIWQLPAPAAWAGALCDKLTSNPTREQWSAWISPDIPYFKLCPAKGDPP